LQPITRQQGIAYRHIILLVLSLKFPKEQSPKSPTTAVVWRHLPEEPPRISVSTLYV